MNNYGNQQVFVADPDAPFSKGFAFVFCCGVIYLIGYFIWEFLSGWGTYPFPFNYSVGFYYYMVSGFVGLFTTPYGWGEEMYDVLRYSQITPYENLNSVIIWMAEFVYAIVAGYAVYKILGVISYLVYEFRLVRWMIFLPAIIGAAIFFALWLFEKPA